MARGSPRLLLLVAGALVLASPAVAAQAPVAVVLPGGPGLHPSGILACAPLPACKALQCLPQGMSCLLAINLSCGQSFPCNLAQACFLGDEACLVMAGYCYGIITSTSQPIWIDLGGGGVYAQTGVNGLAVAYGGVGSSDCEGRAPPTGQG